HLGQAVKAAEANEVEPHEGAVDAPEDDPERREDDEGEVGAVGFREGGSAAFAAQDSVEPSERSEGVVHGGILLLVPRSAAGNPITVSPVRGSLWRAEIARCVRK